MSCRGFSIDREKVRNAGAAPSCGTQPPKEDAPKPREAFSFRDRPPLVRWGDFLVLPLAQWVGSQMPSLRRVGFRGTANTARGFSKSVAKLTARRWRAARLNVLKCRHKAVRYRKTPRCLRKCF
jgi:hypothetical protein